MEKKQAVKTFTVSKSVVAYNFTTNRDETLRVGDVLTHVGNSDKSGIFTRSNGNEVSIDFEFEASLRARK